MYSRLTRNSGANPIFLRNPHPKFNASRHASSVSFSSSSLLKLNVDVKLKSCFFSASRHASPCKPPNAITDHLGIGKPLERVGGKWTTEYPYNPKSHNPSDDPWFNTFYAIFPGYPLLAAVIVCRCDWPTWFNALVSITLEVLIVWYLRSCERTTVVNLQVCFSGKGRDLGLDLNQIAESADTSTYKGWIDVLNETTITLLRHLEYFNWGSISVVSKFGRREANIYHIDQLSFAERFKNKETHVNVNNMKSQKLTSQKSVADGTVMILWSHYLWLVNGSLSCQPSITNMTCPMCYTQPRTQIPYYLQQLNGSRDVMDSSGIFMRSCLAATST